MEKNKINIKSENKGKFTNWANSKGMSVIEAANRVMANTKKYSPTIVKRANFAKNASNWNKKRDGGDIVSTMGYRDDSPFRNSESLNIYSPEGVIDMSNVSKPIMANGQYLKPNSGLNQVPPSSSGYVKETPMMSKYGGNIYKSGGYLKNKNTYVTKDGRETKRGLWANVALKKKRENRKENGGPVPIIPMYYEDSGTPIYRDTTDAPPNVYQKGGNILTYKNNSDYFDNHARYSDDQKYDDLIRKRVYSGNWGYDPNTQQLHKLNKSQQTKVDPKTKKLALEKRADIDTKNLVAHTIPKEDAWNPYGENAAGTTRWVTPEQDAIMKKEELSRSIDISRKQGNAIFSTVASATPIGMAMMGMQGAANLALKSGPEFIKNPSLSTAGAAGLDLLMSSPLTIPAFPAGIKAAQSKGFLTPNTPASSGAGTLNMGMPIDEQTLKKFLGKDYLKWKNKDVVLNSPKSEINWAKWNKDIPKNKPLMDEYIAIEQQAKANNTWMNNPDGSKFTGTPEQFVQQQSQNFKKAFPDILKDYPTGPVNVLSHHSPNKFDSFDKAYNLSGVGAAKYGEGVYTVPKKYYDKYMTQKYDDFGSGLGQKPLYVNYGKNRYDLYANKKGVNQFRQREPSSGASTAPSPGYKTEYHTAVIPYSNKVKSATGNSGMFDMTNPNIYKSLLPIGGAAGIMGATANDKVNTKQKGGNIYNVKSGDTFLGIGNKYNVTPEALTTANPGININKLSLNQNINIPNNAGYGMPQGIFQQYSSTPSIAPRINQTVETAPVQTSLSSTITPEFLEHLRLREGKKVNDKDQHYSYYDSEDKLTGGIGHLMSAKERATYPKGTTIPNKLVSSWLLKDSKKAYNAAIKQAKELGVDNQDFVNSLASVNYQLGTAWNTKHTNTWKLLKEGKFEEAAIEAADSKWNTQTPKRVKDFQEGIGNLYKYGGSTKNYANVYAKGGKMDNSPMVARLDKYMTQYGITNPYLKSAMMGVILAEGSMTGKAENMNYSVSRLPEVWSTFSTTGKRVAKGTGAKYANDLAKKYAKNPQALANFIYGNRLGNSGQDTDDGYTYRGRGLNQLTGKGSYKTMGEKLGVDLVNNPELLNTNPDIQAHSAVRFLYDRIAKELPKLVNKNSKYKKRFGEYVDFNNIDNLKDASFLMTSANAGLGNIPKQEAFNKRLKGSEKYVDLFIEGYTPSENMENFETTQSTQPVTLQAPEIINKQKDNALEFKRKSNVDMLENFNVNNIINQNAIDINIPNDVALDQKNAYIDKLNTSMPGPKNIPRFGQAQLFK